MKKTTNLLTAVLFCQALFGQTGKIKLTGKLDEKANVSVIHIRNTEGVNIPLPVSENRNLSFATDSLEKGFYEVDLIGTIYLNTDYQLNIQPAKEGGYTFTGIGALENNALRKAKKQLVSFIPISKDGKLLQEAYYLEVPLFLQKLDSFQHKVELLFSASKDTFFQKYAALDLQFYGKYLLGNYFAFYGIDQKKQKKVQSMMDTLDRKAPNFAFNLVTLMNSTRVKVMDLESRQKLFKLLYESWNKDNETLFRNSYWYRKALNDFLSFRSSSFRYMGKIKKEYKLEDKYIKTLTAARDELTNPYILSFFEYSLTRSILQATRDSAILHKYYNEYIAKSPQQQYLSGINEIYQAAITYTDNMPAPQFSYKDVNVNSTSLESFHGKYVYIDVWATWCTPCKAEIPHLKQLQQAYHNKNIAFVSISVDEQQNLAKWKTYVKDNHLEGIQLIADNAFESDFIRKMGINTIPRFILIDPSGKIISADALRPSNKELKTLLDKFL